MPNTSERTESPSLPILPQPAMDTNDYYALLDLPAEFTPEELGAAYKAAMPRVLSDVARDSPEAKALTTAIDDAFQTFISESKRRDYDSAHPEYRREAEMRRPRPARDLGWAADGGGTQRDGDGIAPSAWANSADTNAFSELSPDPFPGTDADLGTGGLAPCALSVRQSQSDSPDGTAEMDKPMDDVGEAKRQSPLPGRIFSALFYCFNAALILSLLWHNWKHPAAGVLRDLDLRRIPICLIFPFLYWLYNKVHAMRGDRRLSSCIIVGVMLSLANAFIVDSYFNLAKW